MTATILSTTDYGQFKKLVGNREIDKFHLKRLMETLERKNWLSLHPILVNSNYEIVDGQHRFEAARLLNTEVFYIMSSDIDDNHLIDSNFYQKQFTTTNFIDFFSNKHNIKDYVTLQKYLRDLRIFPKALIALVCGVSSKRTVNDLRMGKFKFTPEAGHENMLEKYKNFMNFVYDKRITPRSMFTNCYFTLGFRWLCMTTGFDESLFYKKLQQKWFDLKPQIGAEGWYKLLLDIYNHKNQDKLQKEFGTTEEI